MKFFALATAAIVSVDTATVTLSDLTTCTQSTDNTDYGNSWSVCDGGAETTDCCGMFYEQQTTDAWTLEQPYCITSANRESEDFRDGVTIANGTVYSWYCLLDGYSDE